MAFGKSLSNVYEVVGILGKPLKIRVLSLEAHAPMSSKRANPTNGCKQDIIHYSSVESTPRLPILFLNVAKTLPKNNHFVPLLLSFFSMKHNSKTVRYIQTFYIQNECNTIEDLPFPV